MLIKRTVNYYALCKMIKNVLCWEATECRCWTISDSAWCISSVRNFYEEWFLWRRGECLVHWVVKTEVLWIFFSYRQCAYWLRLFLQYNDYKSNVLYFYDCDICDIFMPVIHMIFKWQCIGRVHTVIMVELFVTEFSVCVMYYNIYIIIFIYDMYDCVLQFYGIYNRSETYCNKRLLIKKLANKDLESISYYYYATSFLYISIWEKYDFHKGVWKKLILKQLCTYIIVYIRDVREWLFRSHSSSPFLWPYSHSHSHCSI